MTMIIVKICVKREIQNSHYYSFENGQSSDIRINNYTLTRFCRQYVVAAKLLYFIQEKPVWWPFFQSIYSFVSSQFSKVDAIHVHLYLGLCEVREFAPR